MGAAYEILQREKAPYALCGAGRTRSSGSDACGVVCAVTSFLYDHPVYQQAAGACASGCAGVVVLAAVREDVRADAKAAADSDEDEPPHTCRHSLTMHREMVRVRRRASVSATSVSDG